MMNVFLKELLSLSEWLQDHLECIRIKHGRLEEDSWVTVEIRDGLQGRRWAVCDAGLCLNKNGKWEFELLPSNRTDAFLNRCRFDTFEAAIIAALEADIHVYEPAPIPEGWYETFSRG